MKVILVTGSLPPMKCGVGDYTYQLAKSLSAGPDVEIGVLTDEEVSGNTDFPHFRIFPIVKGTLRDIFRVNRIFKEWSPDVVHFQFPTMGYKNWGILRLILPGIAWLNNIPVVMTWHEPMRMTNISLLSDLLSKILLFFAKGLIVVRPNYNELMPAWFVAHVKNKKYGYIPNASTIPVKKYSESTALAVKKRLGINNKKLLVYFGFAFPNKSIEAIFSIADPSCHHVTLVCDLGQDFSYHKKILELMNIPEWSGNCNVTGYLSSTDVAEILAAADAIILPFSNGGGGWNTSIHAAQDQGVFLLTTSIQVNGYSSTENTYYARPGDVMEMKQALGKYLGQRKPENLDVTRWSRIAEDHLNFYKDILMSTV